MDSRKVYKIKYPLNMLPRIGVYYDREYNPHTKVTTSGLKNSDKNILELCASSDEIEMFECEPLQDLIKFKWDSYGQRFHLFGCVVHIVYIVILFLYTDMVYVQGVEAGSTPEENEANMEEISKFSFILLAGILYPAIYETVQMVKTGFFDYLSDLGNYVDLLSIWGSVAMSICHYEYTPYAFGSKVMMSVIVTLAIRRTFNFLRIFEALSPIVTMLFKVIWQLRIFMTFYFILILLFSLMYGVLGVGNYKLKGTFQDTFYKVDEPGGDLVLDPSAPGIEYIKIGLFFGNIFQVVRISMGDFAVIAAADYLPEAENYLFWVIWLITVVLTCIIFLNFIVAEASASYTEVAEQLENYIQLQRADLCGEAESLWPNAFKRESSYPKYIIIRKVET